MGRALDLDGRPVQADRAAVWLIDAGQDFDQGALAGAVFTDQGVDLGGEQRQRNVVESLGSVETFGDAAELGDRAGRASGLPVHSARIACATSACHSRRRSTPA